MRRRECTEMLTRIQLEDAAKCCLDFDCCKCINTRLCNRPGGATQEAAQTALALADMVERLEWIDGEWCPICDGRFEHKPDCELAALLEKVRGEGLWKN